MSVCHDACLIWIMNAFIIECVILYMEQQIDVYPSIHEVHVKVISEDT